MNQIKGMLLGISIILVVILIHLSIGALLITDFVAIIGIIIILIGYFSKNDSE